MKKSDNPILSSDVISNLVARRWRRPHKIDRVGSHDVLDGPSARLDEPVWVRGRRPKGCLPMAAFLCYN